MEVVPVLCVFAATVGFLIYLTLKHRREEDLAAVQVNHSDLILDQLRETNLVLDRISVSLQYSVGEFDDPKPVNVLEEPEEQEADSVSSEESDEV